MRCKQQLVGGSIVMWSLSLALVFGTSFAPQAYGQAPTGEVPKPKPAAANPDDSDIIAYVNGTPITRRELMEELLARKGKEQLPLLINRRIIEQACQQARIQITDAEVARELQEIMTAAGMVDRRSFEEEFLQQRGTTLFEYVNDVIRPGIGMRKLARSRVQVTEEDIQKAFAANYGEKVRCRVIMVSNLSRANEIYEEVHKDHGAFLKAAKLQVDSGLAEAGGLVNMNRHSAYPAIEEAAFKMADGEVSNLIQIARGSYAIVLREGLEPADTSTRIEDVRDKLREDIEEKKLRTEIPLLFRSLREQAVVRDYLNNRMDLKDAVGAASANQSGAP